MSAVWNGQPVAIPCVRSVSWLDSRDVQRSPNCYTNRPGLPGEFRPDLVQTITGAVWHTVHGTATGAIAEPPTCLSENSALAYVQDFARSSRQASTAFVIARTGTAFNILDLVTDRGWGSESWNPFTVQCELDQSGPDAVCLATVETAVSLAWWFCDVFAIQPMIPLRNGEPFLDDSTRLKDEGARTFRGHWFHGNDDSRGRGDPGPELGQWLLGSGFEGFDVDRGEDRVVWQQRQAQLGMPVLERDGIPGDKTIAAMRAAFGRVTWNVRRNAPPCARPQGDSGNGLATALVLGGLGYAGYRYIKRRKKKR